MYEELVSIQSLNTFRICKKTKKYLWAFLMKDLSKEKLSNILQFFDI